MFDLIYVEEEARDHPRTREILARLPKATVVPCDRYGEVFNPRAQDFRLQKRSSALILAQKHGNLILEAPTGYGFPGAANWYLSPSLNCVYDCRYCFLQGMYASAHVVVFVNHEDFARAIDAQVVRADTARDARPQWFFSGYDGDSLALEPLGRFTESILPTFERLPGAWLELRTKSAKIEVLESRAPLPNVVTAMSFTPQAAGDRWENGVPPVARRIETIERVGSRGWPLGLRLDPLLTFPGWREAYRTLIDQLFARLRPAWIHSVSVGAFRLPRDMHRAIRRLYPEEPLFSAGLADEDGVVSYEREARAEIETFVRRELEHHVPASVIVSCRPRIEAA